MYSLLFILLVTPAFGRPTSGQLGSELREAERNILNIYAEQEVEFDEQYFQDYNEAKSYLGETRQDLMELAQRTVKDVRDLKVVLEHLDESTGSVFLTIFTNRMKDLMIETGMIEAREKYESAVKTFENLKSLIKTNNRNLEYTFEKKAAENLRNWKSFCDPSPYSLLSFSFSSSSYSYRLCSLAQQYEKDSLHGNLRNSKIICDPLSPYYYYSDCLLAQQYEKELFEIKTIKDRMMETENNFDKSINEAIDILDDEIDMISIWNKSARVVGKNIDDYPAEILIELKSVRTIFRNGLDDLKNVAEQYLSQPTNILGK